MGGHCITCRFAREQAFGCTFLYFPSLVQYFYQLETICVSSLFPFFLSSQAWHTFLFDLAMFYLLGGGEPAATYFSDNLPRTMALFVLTALAQFVFVHPHLTKHLAIAISFAFTRLTGLQIAFLSGCLQLRIYISGWSDREAWALVHSFFLFFFLPQVINVTVCQWV